MELSKKLQFKKPQITDKVVDSINHLNQNFQQLDDVLSRQVNDPNLDLIPKETYLVGEKLWNASPNTGEYVGWVNTRTGKHGKKWTPNTTYTIGDVVVLNADNGHAYECVEAGKSINVEPTMAVTTDLVSREGSNTAWRIADWNYQVGDRVLMGGSVGDVADNHIYIYICEQAGTTNSVGYPSYSEVPEEGIAIDGTVHWRKRKRIKWKEIGVSSLFKPFGKIEG